MTKIARPTITSYDDATHKEACRNLGRLFAIGGRGASGEAALPLFLLVELKRGVDFVNGLLGQFNRFHAVSAKVFGWIFAGRTWPFPAF